jgi:hypothetical protein
MALRSSMSRGGTRRNKSTLRIAFGDAIDQDHERRRHHRAERFFGKEQPAKVTGVPPNPTRSPPQLTPESLFVSTVRGGAWFGLNEVPPHDQAEHGDTVVHSGQPMMQSVAPPEINTARMLEALSSIGMLGGAGGHNSNSRPVVLRPHEMGGRARSAEWLASEEACARVIAERKNINFSQVRPCSVCCSAVATIRMGRWGFFVRAGGAGYPAMWVEVRGMVACARRSHPTPSRHTALPQAPPRSRWSSRASAWASGPSAAPRAAGGTAAAGWGEGARGGRRNVGRRPRLR